MLSKEREILKNIYNETLDKIDELLKKIDYGDLEFIISSSGTETNFNRLKDPVAFLDSVRKREISIEEVRYKQEEFNRYLKKGELAINLKNKKRRKKQCY